MKARANNIEYHISECCKDDIFFKGDGCGLWCMNCKKEVTRTLVAFNKRELKNLKKMRDDARIHRLTPTIN